MEYCDGQTLQDVRPQSIMEVTRLFSTVAEGLAHMNARGFVHADTKPNNIIIAPNGTVKVIDLGGSCRLGTIKPRIQGTPDFIAPEQVHRRPLDARTDVFNLGATLYWTLTGRAIPTVLPKKGEVAFKTEAALVPAENLRPDIPPSLNKLIADCIEISPSRRPASVAEVGSRLGLITHTLENPHTKTDIT
jgi:serine/threonine-protein kinase